MYTINIFAETLAFLYMAKYFEYDGSQNIAMFMQLGYFHNSYRMVKSVLSFLGADVYDYQNFSLPEMKIQKLKSYILTLSKQQKEEEIIQR